MPLWLQFFKLIYRRSVYPEQLMDWRVHVHSLCKHVEKCNPVFKLPSSDVKILPHIVMITVAIHLDTHWTKVEVHRQIVLDSRIARTLRRFRMHIFLQYVTESGMLTLTTLRQNSKEQCTIRIRSQTIFHFLLILNALNIRLGKSFSNVV